MPAEWQATLKQLHQRMSKLERESSPLAKKLGADQAKGVQWIEPELVCEAEFAEWTHEGILRQAAFISLRSDKPAGDVVREHPRSAKDINAALKTGKAKATPDMDKRKTQGKISVAGVGISHPDRVIDSDKIETPDRLILDLDPDPALPWRSMVEATRLTLTVLDELGLQAFLKTSGGKGMHIIVPLARQADWDTVKTFAKTIAQFITQPLPERFTATMGPKNRVGKIFIDYLRNTRGGSTVTAYSARARPGLPVSVPISRDELADLKSARKWNVGNLHERLDSLKTDPWAGYKNRQRITQKMWKQLGVEGY